jgi:hypothetical protein
MAAAFLLPLFSHLVLSAPAPQLLGPGLIGPPGGNNNPFQATLAGLLNTKPGSAPSTTEDALNQLQSIFGASNGSSNPKSLSMLDGATALIQSGMGPDQLASIASGAVLTGANSIANNNPKNPAQPVFPTQAPGDAPYSLTEAQLRAAIHIPDNFTYGQKMPVIVRFCVS